MKRWLLRLYYRSWHSDSMMRQYLKGRFKVRYPDGKYTVRMSYKTAKNYRDIFGGDIIELF